MLAVCWWSMEVMRASCVLVEVMHASCVLVEHGGNAC